MMAKWFDSITLMVLENTGWSQVLDTEFYRRFKQNGVIFSNYTGIGHPSGPNYRSWLSGRNWSWNEFDGVKRPNLADTVSYKIFGFGGVPAVRHNPFLDTNPADRNATVYLDAADYTDTNIAPICYLGLDDSNNAHSGPLSVADHNANTAVEAWGRLRVPRKLFVLIFDEAFGLDYESNHVFAGCFGSGLTPRTITSRLNHFNLCQFMADNFDVTLAEIDPTGKTYAGQSILELP